MAKKTSLIIPYWMADLLVDQNTYPSENPETMMFYEDVNVSAPDIPR